MQTRNLQVMAPKSIFDFLYYLEKDGIQEDNADDDDDKKDENYEPLLWCCDSGRKQPPCGRTLGSGGPLCEAGSGLLSRHPQFESVRWIKGQKV